MKLNDANTYRIYTLCSYLVANGRPTVSTLNSLATKTKSLTRAFKYFARFMKQKSILRRKTACSGTDTMLVSEISGG